SARIPTGSFNSSTAVTLYYSMVMRMPNVNQLQTATAGLFFAGFNNATSANQPGSASSVGARFYLRANTARTGYQVGVAKTSSSVAYDPTVRSTNDVLFLVYCYQVNTGSGSDDVCKLWVNPSSGTFGTDNVPAETTNTIFDTTADYAGPISSWCIQTRGGGANSSPNALI